jgi:hypothetical protein
MKIATGTFNAKSNILSPLFVTKHFLIVNIEIRCWTITNILPELLRIFAAG